MNFFDKINPTRLCRSKVRKYVIILLIGLLIPFSGYAQKPINLKLTKSTLEEALKKIEIQSGKNLLYNYDDIVKAELVTIEIKSKTLNEALDMLLKNSGFNYKILDKNIIISKNGTSPSKRKIINGIITDQEGVPLISVNIAVKGTKLGTVTNNNGEFSLSLTDGARILVVSYLGYEPQEIEIKDKANFFIKLKENVNMLAEAVVSTGYQTLSKREMASAVSQINHEKINLASKASVDQMLSGQIPGMMVLQTSGEPGAAPTIRIRGTSSIIGTKTPLWVLDGIILEDPVNVDVTNLNSPDAAYLIGNAISGVNPRDIENITVLKDASATAIYGSRAANGVIVVNTKKGREGKTTVSYSGNFSLSQRIGYGDLKQMNAGERVRLSQEIIEDGIKYSSVPLNLGYEGLLLDYYNNKLSYDDFTAKIYKMVDNNTDWYDILFRNSITNNHTVNLSGGSDRTTYYTSLGYSKNLGTAKGSSQERFSGMAKINSWITKKIYVGFQLNAANTKNIGFHPSVNPNKYAYETSRTIPLYNEDGSYFMYQTMQKGQIGGASAPNEELLYNILNEINYTGSNTNISAVTAQINLQINFTDNLRYKMLTGVDQSRTSSQNWAKEESNYVALIRRWNKGSLVPGTDNFDKSVLPWGGVLTNSDQRKDAYTFRNTLEFSKLLKNKHMLNVMGAVELRSVTYKGFSGTYYGWQPERGQTISPAITTAYKDRLSSLRPSITDNIVNNLSWIGSATYSYKDKITINGNLRADGSNNFGSNPKYRFLPIWSVAGKYTMSNESFLKNNKNINYLAIRASYGIQGNIDKSSSPELIIQVGSRNPITGLDESFFKYLPNPNLRWEKTTSYNLGFDFAFIANSQGNSIISGSFDYYDKKGNDMIVLKSVSQVMGLDQVKINGGRIRNRGTELSLKVIPFETKDFSTSANLIFSYNENTLIEANRDVNVTPQDKISGTALIEGMPIGAIYSYQFAGLNEKYGFPMFYNKDDEKRYELYQDEMKVVYSGVSTPNITGGIELSARYKKLFVNLGFQYSIGGVSRLPSVYRSNYYSVFDPASNVSKDMNNRWRKPGDEAFTNIPVIYDGDKYSVARTEFGAPKYTGSVKSPLEMYDYSDLRIAKTDNLRLRNINVSYLFSPEKLKKYGIQTLSVNIQAENLFVIASKAWQGRDPESGSSNIPLPKVYSIGVNISF